MPNYHSKIRIGAALCIALCASSVLAKDKPAPAPETVKQERHIIIINKGKDGPDEIIADRVNGPGDEDVTEITDGKKITRIVMHRTGETDAAHIAEIRAKCDGQADGVSNSTSETTKNGKKTIVRVLTCRRIDTEKTRLSALIQARDSVATVANMDADSRAKALAGIDAAIARVKGK